MTTFTEIYQKFMIRSDDLKITYDKQLGSGSIAGVYEGKYTGDDQLEVDVAVKVYDVRNSKELNKNLFEQSVRCFVKVHSPEENPNIVKFYGWLIRHPKEHDIPQYEIVLEKMAMSLHDRLVQLGRQNEQLAINEIRDIIIQCCRAYKALADNKFVTFDISLGNILLTDNSDGSNQRYKIKSKIADFDTVTKQQAGADGLIDDVRDFGKLIYQLLKKPQHEKDQVADSPTKGELDAVRNDSEHFRRTNRRQDDESQEKVAWSRKIVYIMLECTQSANQRPTFAELEVKIQEPLEVEGETEKLDITADQRP